MKEIVRSCNRLLMKAEILFSINKEPFLKTDIFQVKDTSVKSADVTQHYTEVSAYDLVDFCIGDEVRRSIDFFWP